MESTTVSHGIAILDKVIKEVEAGIDLAPGVESFPGIGNLESLVDTTTSLGAGQASNDDDTGEINDLIDHDYREPGWDG